MPGIVDSLGSLAPPTGNCAICGAPLTAPLHYLREMMFGLGHTFTYAECAACQCLQLRPMLNDVSTYYPPDYYAFQHPNSAGFGFSSDSFRRTLAFYFAGYGLNPKSRILDIGSGAGSLLEAFARAGFRNCLGIDPYIASDSQLSIGPRIRKAHISDIDPEWDIVLFNHSFEHLRDPFGSLRAVNRILAPTGVCVIRMPTVPCHAWEYYGANWVQLDAPRHIFIHSAKSLRILADAAGLTHTETRYDSTSVQFWGSELYRRGIPFVGSDHSRRSFFTTTQLVEFAQDATNLNLNRRGDQAAFYLQKRCGRPRYEDGFK